MIHIPLILLGAGGIAALGKLSQSPESKEPDPMSNQESTSAVAVSATVEQWRNPILAVLPDSEFPIAGSLTWIQIESGGSACGVGSMAQMQRDGYAREAGIGQNYFESATDKSNAGVTSKQLRSMCSMTSQQPIRQLTDAEVTMHVNAFAGLVRACMASAKFWLAKGGVDFDAISAHDKVCYTKLVHAYPVLIHATAAITAKLGHAPESYEEYAAAVIANPSLVPAPGPANASQFPRLFDNPRRCAANVTAHRLSITSGRTNISNLGEQG